MSETGIMYELNAARDTLS